jgi:hypothetical protein
VNLAAPVQTRVLVLVALAAALGLAAFMMMRSGATGSDESTPSVSPRTPVSQTPAGHVPAPVKTPARPAKPVKPAVVLLPGLPHGLAKALRRERVVVALVYAPHAGDMGALKQARAGAHEVGAGFVALNVFDERTARPLEQLVGPISDPSVLVVKRPGKVAMRLDGFADAATVAQAAHNAGAR